MGADDHQTANVADAKSGRLRPEQGHDVDPERFQDRLLEAEAALSDGLVYEVFESEHVKSEELTEVTLLIRYTPRSKHSND